MNPLVIDAEEKMHTPGPWKVLDGAVLSEELNAYGNWIVVSCQRERTPQDEANLRLIASAPAMLEALQAYELAVDKGIEASPELWANAARLSHAAINLARGEG